MKRINFERIEIFVDIDKTRCSVENYKKDFANIIYQLGRGIEAHALAFKIFNSNGEIEYNDEETAIIIAMGIDFISGIQKAKQRGELRTSKKYKMTATKAKKYFNPFLTLVMIDLICCIVIPFPVFAMLWAAYCVFCEFKSVREKSWEKAELRKAEKTMSIIIENKDDIARLAAQILFETQKEKEDKNDTGTTE